MKFDLLNLLMSIPAVIIAIGFHEAAHAFMAYKCGDNTAKNMGRLTINPLKHIDPIGFIMLFLCHFGWAKPVPVNPNNFKNRKKDTILVAAAGPIMNLILAFIFAVIFVICIQTLNVKTALGNTLSIMIYMTFSINVSLAVFNMLPIPPLDGSRIFEYILPHKYRYKMFEYQNIIQIVMIVLLFTGILSFIISPIIGFIMNMFMKLASLLVFGLIKLINYLINIV